MGYYETVTSTIDWCEPNYTHSYYIAEFYNSLSNIVFILSGIAGVVLSRKLGYEAVFWVQYMCNIVIGIGSFAFHATLQYNGQQMDELSMVFTIIFYIMLIQKSRLLSIALTVYSCVFSVLYYNYPWPTLFQIHFILWYITALVLHYLRLKDGLDYIVYGYVSSVVIGFFFWNLDFHFCEELHWLKGHAIWHILMGINSWYGPTFSVYVRAQDLNPRIRWKWGMPYVDVKKLS